MIHIKLTKAVVFKLLWIKPTASEYLPIHLWLFIFNFFLCHLNLFSYPFASFPTSLLYSLSYRNGSTFKSGVCLVLFCTSKNRHSYFFANLIFHDSKSISVTTDFKRDGYPQLVKHHYRFGKIHSFPGDDGLQLIFSTQLKSLFNVKRLKLDSILFSAFNSAFTVILQLLFLMYFYQVFICCNISPLPFSQNLIQKSLILLSFSCAVKSFSDSCYCRTNFVLGAHLFFILPNDQIIFSSSKKAPF